MMQVAIEDIPTDFANYFNITTASAQVLLSTVVFLTILLPVMFLSRGNKSVTVEAVAIILTLSMLVGIGWLPFWVLVMAVAVITLLWARMGADLVSGE